MLIAGLLLTAGGLIWFSQVSADGGYLTDILGPSLLAAFGLGFAFVLDDGRRGARRRDRTRRGWPPG